MITVTELMELVRKGEPIPKTRRRSSYSEHRMQAAQISYMKAKHFDLSRVFFAVPNGQKRTSAQTAWMKEEGLLAGVSDLILLKPNKYYGYLCIENKTPNGKQSKEQLLFQEAVERNGGKYIIVRSLDEFITEIENYLKDL